MKIKCEYCGSMFDDTLENCPACGAPNQSVRRSTADQPTTIEGLKEWYESKGLPPEDVTRFFIGKDIREAKAFGIYKDENSGNFIVYKNKADGTRAVRYEGTDEAYAVNELHTRLKQEILEQKAHNIANGSASGNTGTAGGTQNANPAVSRKNKIVFRIIIIALIVFFAGPFVTALGFLGVAKVIEYVTTPANGYYQKDGNVYYHFDLSDWAVYSEEEGEWIGATITSSDELYQEKTASPYYYGSTWDASLNVPDFQQSLYYDDYQKGFENKKGYYNVNDTTYYYMPYSYGGWYCYDDDVSDWSPVSKNDLPADLKHCQTAQDFWYTPTWDTSVGNRDFEQTSFYKDYEAASEAEAKSTSDSDSDYSWSSTDSWDSGGTDWGSDW